MEIWYKSRHVESTNRIVASQPQSRVQTVEIPYQDNVPLSAVDFGELLITVVKGKGIIKTQNQQEEIEQGDQVYLVEGDEFGLLRAKEEVSFVVQIYWAPQITLIT